MKVKESKKRVGAEAAVIGRNLRRLRLERGYSQKNLADGVRTSFQQIQKYESGQNRLPAEKLLHLKRILDVPFDAFFDGLAAAEPSSDMSLDVAPEALVLRLHGLPSRAFRQKLLRAFMLLSSPEGV